MPANVRLKLNIPAFNEYRNDPSVVDALETIAHEIAARANAAVTAREYPEDGDAFKVNTVHNRTRAVTFVFTGGFDGELAEATTRALSRAVG